MASKSGKSDGTAGATETALMARLRALEAEARGAPQSWGDVDQDVLYAVLDECAKSEMAIMLRANAWQLGVTFYPKGRGKGVSFAWSTPEEAAEGLQKAMEIS